MSNNKLKILFQCALACGLAAVLAVPSQAQSANKYIRKGNKQYKTGDYTDAEAQYKKALSRDSMSSAGLFNLGNSLYQQRRYQDAMQQYAASARHSASGTDQSAATYNIGNTFMSARKWEDAIKAYKQSLLKNPSDAEARYNLAYAQKMLKKKKQGGGGGGKQNKNQKNNKNNKNKQNSQNNQQNKQNKDQNKQNQQQNQNKDQQQQRQHPQPQPSKITPQRAQQLLNAANQAEKKLQEQKDKKKKGVEVYSGKDW